MVTLKTHKTELRRLSRALRNLGHDTQKTLKPILDRAYAALLAAERALVEADVDFNLTSALTNIGELRVEARRLDWELAAEPTATIEQALAGHLDSKIAKPVFERARPSIRFGNSGVARG